MRTYKYKQRGGDDMHTNVDNWIVANWIGYCPVIFSMICSLQKKC